MTDTYTPGKTYELTTILDVILLYGRLPQERADLLLTEIAEGIRLSAPTMKMINEIAGGDMKAQPFQWIDDDKREGTVNYRNADNLEDHVSFKFRGGDPAHV